MDQNSETQLNEIIKIEKHDVEKGIPRSLSIAGIPKYWSDFGQKMKK